MANRLTKREVERINAFERKWNISTNIAKFKVIPIATKTPAPLIIEEEEVPFSNHGSILGLQIGRYGYTSHVRARAERARRVLRTLYRFRDISTKIKLHLVKTKVIPILIYPPVPIHALSKTDISKLQKVQNAALRFALNKRWDDFYTSRRLHEEAELPPLNIRLHILATNIWEKMAAEEWDLGIDTLTLHRDTPGDSHPWFPRSFRCLETEDDPEPKYL